MIIGSLITAVSAAVSTATKSTASTSTVSTSSSGSSHGGGGASWQDTMAKTASDPTKIASEIQRAQSIIASGKGTDATQRYLNQMNALKDGASLSKVVSGAYDNYRVDSSFYKDYRTGVAPAPAPAPVVAPAPVQENWNAQKQWENAGYGGGYQAPSPWGGAVGVTLPGGVGRDLVPWDYSYDNRSTSQGVGQGVQAAGAAVTGAVQNAVGAVTPDWMKWIGENGIVVLVGMISAAMVMKIFGK